MIGFPKRAYPLHAHLLKLAMRDCKDHGVISTLDRGACYIDPILQPDLVRIDLGVPDIDASAIIAEFLDNIYHASITDIRTILFESQAHHQDS